ncbi:MAG TPA: DUF2059 domain-containing protein [Woeseiaceae bacterium]|nr:DUF2059 domain-containing protein [Woeseiaceae bacterium]
MSKLILLLSLALPAGVVFAQEQSHTDAAKELLDLMNSDQSIEQAYDQMYVQMSGMADQLGITEEQRPIFDRYMEKMVVVMKEEMNWKKMEPHLIKAYVSVYSEDEIRELNEFYSSPLGQKFISKMPELMEATMVMTQDMMGEMIPRFTEIQKELYADLKKDRSAAK